MFQGEKCFAVNEVNAAISRILKGSRHVSLSGSRRLSISVFRLVGGLC